MGTTPTLLMTSPDGAGRKEESGATRILKILVGYLSGQNREPGSLNITSVMLMFDQLTEEGRQVLYNATVTSSKEELIHMLNITIMQPRQLDEFMGFQEYRIQKILHLYIPPILILLGTFGNLFSFIVLRRKPMLKVSSYLYLAVLAIIDTLVLYNGLLRIWIVELMSFDYQGSGNWICKLTVAFGYVSSDLSVWLIIAVTVERYIVVCFPFQASSMCNVSRARKVIVGLLLLMFCLNVHFMWTAEVVEEQGVSICRGGDQFRHLVEEVWPWVDTLIYSFLPFVTITILNVLIIREVAGAHSSRMRMTASDSDTTTSSSGNIHATSFSGSRRGTACEGTRLTALLLTVSFTFLLLTLPNNIALIVSRFWNQKYEGIEDTLSPEERHAVYHGMARFKLVTTITELLMYTNHSINFFLYCATGNKFRQQILELLTCLQRHPQPQTQVEHSWTSHSVRKTSQPVLTSEMTQAVRPSRRKNSCISNLDPEMNQESEQFLAGEHHKPINRKGNFTAKMNKSFFSVNTITFKDSFHTRQKQQVIDEGENYELSNLEETSLRKYNRRSPENFNEKSQNKKYVKTHQNRSSESDQEKPLESYQEITIENYQKITTDSYQEITIKSYQETSMGNSHVKCATNCHKCFQKNFQDNSSEKYQKIFPENNKERSSENYHTCSPKNSQLRRGSSLKAFFGNTTNDSQIVQIDLCPDVDLDNNDQYPLHLLGTCKVYQCNQSQRHSIIPKRSIFSSALSLNSRDKEYFLLKPAVGFCGSATLRHTSAPLYDI